MATGTLIVIFWLGATAALIKAGREKKARDLAKAADAARRKALAERLDGLMAEAERRADERVALLMEERSLRPD